MGWMFSENCGSNAVDCNVDQTFLLTEGTHSYINCYLYSGDTKYIISILQLSDKTWRHCYLLHSRTGHRSPLTQKNFWNVASVKSPTMMIHAKRSFSHATIHSALIALLHFRNNTAPGPSRAQIVAIIHNSQQMALRGCKETFILTIWRKLLGRPSSSEKMLVMNTRIKQSAFSLRTVNKPFVEIAQFQFGREQGDMKSLKFQIQKSLIARRYCVISITDVSRWYRVTWATWIWKWHNVQIQTKPQKKEWKHWCVQSLPRKSGKKDAMSPSK